MSAQRAKGSFQLRCVLVGKRLLGAEDEVSAWVREWEVGVGVACGCERVEMIYGTLYPYKEKNTEDTDGQ